MLLDFVISNARGPLGHEKIPGGIFLMPMALIKDVIWVLLIAAACVGFVALGKEVWDLLT